MLQRSDSAFYDWGIRHEKVPQSPIPEVELVDRAPAIEEPESPNRAEFETLKSLRGKKGKRKSTAKVDDEGLSVKAAWGSPKDGFEF